MLEKNNKKPILTLFAYLIPILIAVYVVFSAWQPIVYKTVYTLDLSSKDTTDSGREFYLDGKKSSISPLYSSNYYSYREISTDNPIYFNLRQNLTKDARSVTFGLQFDSNSQILIGFLNPLSKKLEWKVFYDPDWKNYVGVVSVEDSVIYASPWWVEKNCGSVIEDCFENLNINNLNKWIETNVPKYSSVNFVGFDYKQSDYVNTDLHYKSGYTSGINTSLRGTHEFYVYLKDSLELEVWKNDINAESGADVLSVELYDVNYNLIYNDTIPDDTIQDKSKKSIPQVKELKTSVGSGVYILKFNVLGKDDITIKKIRINTNKIVAKGKLYLLEDTTLYIVAPNKAEIEFETKNKEKNNKISIFGESPNTIPLKESGKVSSKVYGDNSLVIPFNIKISSNLNFAFKKQNFFHPFSYYITDEKPDFLIINNPGDILYYNLPSNIDYVAIKKLGKSPVKLIKAELIVKK